jgi:hypothetical protein
MGYSAQMTFVFGVGEKDSAIGSVRLLQTRCILRSKISGLKSELIQS